MTDEIKNSSLLNDMSNLLVDAQVDYDNAILEELQSKKLDLAEENIVSLSTNEIKYKYWSLVRTNQLITKFAHLPLRKNTIYQLDMLSFEMIAKLINENEVETDIQHCIQIRSSSLQHKDFATSLIKLTRNISFKNITVFVYFNERYDKYCETFNENFDLLKGEVANIFLDNYGDGYGSLFLSDALNFDGFKLHNSIKILDDIDINNDNLLITLITKKMKDEGKIVIAPLAFTPELIKFYKKIGCDFGTII